MPRRRLLRAPPVLLCAWCGKSTADGRGVHRVEASHLSTRPRLEWHDPCLKEDPAAVFVRRYGASAGVSATDKVSAKKFETLVRWVAKRGPGRVSFAKELAPPEGKP